MTTLAHSQEPQEQEGPPVKKGRGMVGFYVATGVGVALFVGGWFAWTPVKAQYYLRQLRAHGERWETDEDAPMGPFRMKKIGTTLSCLNITIYPREISRYPKFTKPFLYYLIIKPSLQKYLSSVLNGFQWYITKNERVKKNQFGTHKWFSD